VVTAGVVVVVLIGLLLHRWDSVQHTVA